MININSLLRIVSGICALACAGVACNFPRAGEKAASSEPLPTLPAAITIVAETPSPTAIPPTETPSPDIDFEGVSFSFDDSLASSVKAELVPESTYEDAPVWDVTPEFSQFLFEGYLLGKRFHQPAVRVYSVAAYQQVEPGVMEVVNNLKLFLETCPNSPDQIPFLPHWNAAQMLQTKVVCFEFQNGKGVRFLSQYGQAAYPVNNDSLFYTFQGLTTDGAYYISAFLPVSHPSLPENGENPPDGNWDAFYEAFVPYLVEMEQKLNAEPDESYHPALTLLDDMMKSLQIE